MLNLFIKVLDQGPHCAYQHLLADQLPVGVISVFIVAAVPPFDAIDQSRNVEQFLKLAAVFLVQAIARVWIECHLGDVS